MQRHCALPVLAFLLLLSRPAAAEAPAAPVHEHAHEHAHGDEHGEIEKIVVTATPLPHQADELATPVDRLTRDQIVEDLRSTIGETVGNLPGVTQSGFTAGASRPVIRGQDAYRTEVLEGGLSTQDVSRLSPDHAIPVNPISAQSIEVVRGPGVLRYGGGASAGVVNAITNRVPNEPIAEKARGEALGAYQHNGNGGDFGALLEGGLGDFAWHLDGLYRNSDDYENGEGRTEKGTDTSVWSISAGASYLFETGRIGLSYARYESEYGIPQDEPIDVDMRTNRIRFEGDWESPLTGIREITLRGVYSDYTHDEVAGGAIGQTFDNDEFDGRLEGVHEPVLGFFGAFGLHGRHQDLTASGEAAEFLAPSDTAMFAAYLFEERALAEFVDLELGLRIEGVWVEGTPRSGDERRRGFAPISGSVALIAHPADPFTVGLTATASQRAPSQVELFARGPHEATATFELGDPGFDEETSYTGELRVAADNGRFGFELSGFATHYRHYIFGQLTGVRVDEDGAPDPAGELDQLFYRNRNASFYGGELTIGIELAELFGGVVGTDWQIDYVRARFSDGRGNQNVPRIPPMRWGGSLYYEHDRVSARFGFLRHQAQWTVAANEFATSAYTMLDLSARYRLVLFEDRAQLDLGFTARNLLDEAARNAVSFTKDRVLLPGRSFRVSLHASF
jgi:iron complex outermembrane receptor protein